MKARIFTFLFTALFFGGLNVSAQEMDLGTGVNWDDLAPGSPLVINENFQGYAHFHSDDNESMGNSAHALADDGITVIWGYKDMVTQVPILNGGRNAVVDFTFTQAAFGPEWRSAYAYDDFINTGTGENSPRVSNGFVELSRFDTVYSDIPTAHGSLVVDLRPLEYVEMIQWSHSSTGGKRRGALCEFSLDDGTTWDTLRYQPGEAWASSFTKDVFTLEKTPNYFRCEPSAYGMTWADGIYSENVMLRFGEVGGQTVRLHDLKVYGDIGTPDAVHDVELDAINMYSSNKQIFLSEVASGDVYNLAGALVRRFKNSKQISMDRFPNGFYLVKAMVGDKVQTTRLSIK